MILYVNGCSFTAGTEIIKESPNAGEDRTKPLAWPHKLGKLCGATHVINAATPGGSNRRMVRTTIDWTLKNADKAADCLVIIQWTDTNRYEFESGGKALSCVGHERFLEFAKTDSERELYSLFRKFMSHTKTHQENALFDTVMLHNTLNSLGFRHLFVNSMWPSFMFEALNKDFVRKVLNTISDQNYVGKLDDTLSFLEVLDSAGFSRTAGYHYFEDGHEHWAKFIFNELNKSNLCGNLKR